MGSLSKFWGGCKKTFAWIKTNAAILLLSFGLIAVSVIIFCCQRRSMKALKIELALLKTQLKLEKLAVEKDVKVQQLADLKKQDKELNDALDKIKEDLTHELSPDMTEEEIAEQFKALGHI